MMDSDLPAHPPPAPESLLQRVTVRGPAPVHLWNPPYCGDLALRITADGQWLHEGRPIRRPAMVKAFANLMKREGERYFLVTPVEKVGIQVDEWPFVTVDLEVSGSGDAQCLRFTTNVGDEVMVSAEHPLRVETAEDGAPRPRVRVRGELWARVGRADFYRLVDLAEARRENAQDWLGVTSQGVFFPLGEAPPFG